MKRDTLKELGLSDEAIDRVMAENGKDIEAAKASGTSALQKAEAALKEAREQAATAQAEAEAAKAQAANAAKAYEVKAQVAAYLQAKPFVNEITRGAIAAAMESGLNGDEAKTLDAVFAEVTSGQEGLFREEAKAPAAPVVTQMSGGEASEGGGVTAAFRKLNPQLKL